MTAGLRQGGIFDSAVQVSYRPVIIAIPIFVLGFLAQFLFGVHSPPVTVGETRASAACCYLIVLGAMSFAYVVIDLLWPTHTLTMSAPPPPRGCRTPVVTVHILVQFADSGGDLPGRGSGRALMGGAIVTKESSTSTASGAYDQAVTRQDADGGVDRDGAGAGST